MSRLLLFEISERIPDGKVDIFPVKSEGIPNARDMIFPREIHDRKEDIIFSRESGGHP